MKKGQLEHVMVPIVLLLVSTIALFILVNQIMQEGASNDIEKCKLTVSLAAGAKRLSAGSVDIGASCPRTDTTFTNEKPKEISKRIAQELYNCGDRFSFGDVNFAAMATIFPPDKLNCLICSNIQFDNPQVIARYKEDPEQFRKDTTEEMIQEGHYPIGHTSRQLTT